MALKKFNELKVDDNIYFCQIPTDKARGLPCNDIREENGITILYYSNLGIEYPYDVFEDKEKLLEEIKKH